MALCKESSGAGYSPVRNVALSVAAEFGLLVVKPATNGNEKWLFSSSRTKRIRSHIFDLEYKVHRHNSNEQRRTKLKDCAERPS